MDAAAGTAAALPEAWSQVRAPVIVPLLRLAVAVCLTMSVLLFLERMYMAVVIAGVRLLRLRPERRYRCDPIPEDDPELGSEAFPSVLVQIPMFNEREVRTHLLPASYLIISARIARPPLLGASRGGRMVGFRLTSGAAAGVPAVNRRGVRAVVAVGPAGGAGARRLHGRSD
jgi:hypothetical protein